jgi:hypothetical protein
MTCVIPNLAKVGSAKQDERGKDAQEQNEDGRAAAWQVAAAFVFWDRNDQAETL